ncbi:helix-turn-helix domain-containing protein [Embleya sp. NBC_00896]|uniref:helix-turn-helix domain-containing protein n=1 Tax=Embleya sp. NBC_00896 TaxID=2975961 RepID=UPI00386A83CC|nr:helix-turn-helix domain-containing protein [Embleya sp. NBC_00896]
MPTSQDPMICRRRLRDTLRRLRESAGLTQRDVATELEWSLSKVIRIESGSVGVTITDLRALIHKYGISDRTRMDELLALARAARERTQWSSYRTITTPTMLAFLGFESSAATIRNFEPIRIPGLLQTEDYARALLDHLFQDNTVEERVRMRMDRQRILDTGTNGPRLNFVIDECALYRPIGGITAMRRQLRHLLAITDHPQVVLRIAPLSAGLNSIVNVGYTIFEFHDPEDGVVLTLEGPEYNIIRENLDVSAPLNYLEDFWRLEQIAHIGQAADLLRRAIAYFDREPDPNFASGSQSTLHPLPTRTATSHPRRPPPG